MSGAQADTTGVHRVGSVPAPATGFVVFSDDWGEHPSSCQHIFRQIGKRRRVLWVNTVGMRLPKLSMADATKAVRKLRKMLLGSAERGAGAGAAQLDVHPCQPPMLPLPRLWAARQLNRAAVVVDVRRRLASLGLRRPVLVTTVPNACDYVGWLGESRVVYYCVDDFSEWPGHDSDAVRAMEDELVRKADVFIATSERLHRRLGSHGKPTHLLTHGVDLDHFRSAAAAEHPCLSQIPSPRVGYYGLFDERSDQDLLAQVARLLPDVSFVVTGPVEVDTSRLRSLPNVHFTGKVPYDELPAVLRGWKACFLPYVRSELTEAINPLKLKEYMATGLPVVATPIPEVVRLSDTLEVASTAQEWATELRLAVEGRGRDRRARREELLASESWEAKASQFLDMALGAPSPSG